MRPPKMIHFKLYALAECSNYSANKPCGLNIELITGILWHIHDYDVSNCNWNWIKWNANGKVWKLQMILILIWVWTTCFSRALVIWIYIFPLLCKRLIVILQGKWSEINIHDKTLNIFKCVNKFRICTVEFRFSHWKRFCGRNCMASFFVKLNI